MAKQPRPLPPHPIADRCVFGNSPASTGWRWFSGLGAWERVCGSHRGPGKDYVPDTANVERELA